MVTRELSPYTGRLFNDSKGRIWIESSLPAMLVYDNDHDKVNIANEIKYHDFYDLTDDGKENFYITGISELFHLKEESDHRFNVRIFDVPDKAGFIYSIYRLWDGSLLTSGQNGLFKMELENGNLVAEKVELLNSSDSTVHEGAQVHFLNDGHHVYLLSDHEILRSSIINNEPLTDSRIFVEQLALDFPDIDLVSGQRIFATISDGKGGFYIRSINGIYHYEPKSNTAEVIKAESYGDIGIAEGDFREALYYDSINDILWAGTDHGLLKIVFGNKPFHTLYPESGDEEKERVGKLMSVVVDSRGHLWVGSDSNGLYHSIPDASGKFRSFTNYLPDPENPNSVHSSNIAALFEDSRKRLWVGADNIQWMDLNDSPGIFHYPEASRYAAQINHGLYPDEISEDPQGNILVLSMASLSWLIRPDGNESYVILLDSTRGVCNWPIIHYTQDETGYMFNDYRFYRLNSGWTLNNGGTYFFHGDSLWIQHLKNRTLLPWAYPTETEVLLNLDSIHLLIAKFLIKEKNHKKEVWMPIEFPNKVLWSDIDSLEANLSSNLIPEEEDRITYIFDLFQDKRGMVWGTSTYGLVRFNSATGIGNYYYSDDGLPTNKFYWGHCVSEDGTIYTCSTDGLVYFNPDSILSDPAPEVYISGFRLFYEPVRVDDEAVLRKSILQTDQIRLQYNQNFIGFSFSAFCYRNSERVQYKYMLEGVDEDWVSGNVRHEIDYPNLRPGLYTFRVIAANGNGIWNKVGDSLDIRILHPLWFRWWSTVLEILLALLLLILYIRYRERNLNQRALLLEQKVEEKTHQILEQRKEVDEMKSRFYTNISHEFRTPLTLLISPIDDALKNGREEITVSRRIMEIMMRNARRLQHLINQLLDISKLESGKMELQLTKTSLSDFVRIVASSFLSLAESRGIQFNLHIEQEITETCFDTDKMEKIITNLLSNAFKFCDQGR